MIVTRWALPVVMLFTVLTCLGAQDRPEKDDVPWTELFEKEAWYKSSPGKAQLFVGKLEAIPNADGPSTLQRTTYYKLGKRTIYTGAKKVPALDKLVGKEVEIRGKAVDMNLEGQSLKEIWPAAVRLVSGKKNAKRG